MQKRRMIDPEESMTRVNASECELNRQSNGRVTFNQIIAEVI